MDNEFKGIVLGKMHGTASSEADIDELNLSKQEQTFLSLLLHIMKPILNN